MRPASSGSASTASLWSLPALRIDAVYFGQELIDDGVGDARAVADASSTLTDRVHLVEDDRMQHGPVWKSNFAALLAHG